MSQREDEESQLKEIQKELIPGTQEVKGQKELTLKQKNQLKKQAEKLGS